VYLLGFQLRLPAAAASGCCSCCCCSQECLAITRQASRRAPKLCCAKQPESCMMGIH